MSNIFNEGVVRQRFSQLFTGISSTERSILDQISPEQPIQPPDEIRNSTEAADRVSALGIKMLRTRAVHELEEVKTDKILPSNIVNGIEPRIVPENIQLPSSSRERVPRYVPSHHIEKYDVKLFRQVAYQAAEEAARGLEGTALKDYTQAINEYCFSSGTSIGQLKRLRKILDVAHGKNGNHINKTLKAHKLNRVTAATLLSQTLPLGKTKEPLPPLTELMSNYIGFNPPKSYKDPDDAVAWDALPVINVKAAAGLPFIGQKKGAVKFSVLAIASQFQIELSELLGKRGSLNLLWERWWWLSLSQMFPKGERYKRSDLETKTRNIFAVPFVSNIFGMMLAEPLTKSTPLNCSNYKTVSLAKWHPFRGNLQRFLDQATSPGHHYWIYSDNVYISYEERPASGEKRSVHHFYSIDLEKGEANATREMVAAVGYYLLTRGWTDEEGKPAYNATWAATALVFCPVWFCDIIALFYNLQLKVPGQASGQAWTFITNHLVSSILMKYWNERHKPQPGSPDFTSLSEKSGIDFKIENVVYDLETRMLQAKSSATGTGWLGAEPLRSGKDEINLDLLGWSAVYSPKLGKFVPVLQWDRLLRTMALPKREVNVRYKLDFNARGYQISRLEAALLVGAWRDPVLRRAALHEITFQNDALRSLGVTIAEVRKAQANANNNEFKEVYDSLGLQEDVIVSESLLEKLNTDELPEPLPKNPPQETLKGVTNVKRIWELKQEHMLDSLTSTSLYGAAQLWSETKAKMEVAGETDVLRRDLKRATKKANAALEDLSTVADIYSNPTLYEISVKTKEVDDVQNAIDPVATSHYPRHRNLPGTMAMMSGASNVDTTTLSKTQKRNRQSRRSKKIKRDQAAHETPEVAGDFTAGKARKHK